MKSIKIYFAIGAILFGSTFLFSQQQNQTKAKPNKILGIAKENKSIAYYKEQSLLWQEVIEGEADNAEAWHYYYKAERARLQLEEVNWWNDKERFYAMLAPIMERAKQHIGDEFEYHYIMGLNSEGDASIASLKKAYEIDPERTEVYGWLITYYIPRFNEVECRDLAKKMLKYNTYSDANLKWNYNALVSVEENGLLITNGDMDGLPKWILQYGANIREDVLIVNKSLLATNEEHRLKVYEKVGLDLPSKTESDFEDTGAYADYIAIDLLKRFKGGAYISAGTSLQFFKDNGLEDKMFLVGNALKYSETAFDNVSIIKDNFENKYYMEYLFKNFQSHPEDDVVKTRMNLTYLPAIVLLKKYYKSIDNQEKFDYYNRLMNKIATDSGKKDKVLNWFDK